MKTISSLILFILLIVMVQISCTREKSPGGDQCDTTEELIFHSGFEPETAGTPEDAITDITGTDLSFTDKNNWTDDLEGNPFTGMFSIQYQGGDTSQRYARISEGPVNPQNRTLLFNLSEPNVENIKGRIQANLYGNYCLREFYEEIRFYLSPEFAILLGEAGTPSFNWLTLFEFWNNANWTGEDYPFRISVNLEKPDTGIVDHLNFQAHGQIIPGDAGTTTLWEAHTTDIIVPIGIWVTAEIYVKEGDPNTGRFFFAVTREGGERQVVFDINDYTRHPDDPEPDGFTHINPMKLYTSAGLLQYMQDHGSVLRVYWDDFGLWRNKKPE